MDCGSSHHSFSPARLEGSMKAGKFIVPLFFALRVNRLAELDRISYICSQNAIMIMDRRKVIVNPLEKEFISLLTDFGFKRVFGSREHAGILLRFLNALFEGEMRVESVEFKDKELLPERMTGKRVLYDIYCTTDSGKHFILEMQQEESENFSSRILFYAAKALVDQGIKGVEYVLDPVYCVVITNFNLSGMRRSLVKDLMMMDKVTHEVYSENLRVMFISLIEVPDDWNKCESELTRMLYLIKNMENMTKESKPYLTGEYEDLFNASSTGNLTREEATAYSQSYFKELDHQSALRFTASKSMAEGIAKEKLETARRLISLGYPDDVVIQATCLSSVDLEKLRK